jgi:hypothetical protein
MVISTNLNFLGREQVNIIDVERICQRCVSGFTSNGLAMVTHAFDFMANLNKDFLMSRDVVDNISRTHT